MSTGLPETTPVEIWFEMLCSRGLCQTGKPHIWNRSACMSSNVCHQIIYLAIELSSSSWVIAYRVPRNDKAKLHRLEAGDGSSPACATGWILRMTRLRLSSAALRPGGMDFGCIDF